MSPTQAARFIALWEQGVRAGPVDRCLTLLSAVEDRPASELERWPIGARDAGLLRAWRAWFGDDLPCLDTCPRCGEVMEFTLSATALLVEPPEADAPVALEAEGLALALRRLDSRDLRAVVGLAPERAARRLAEAAVLSAERAGEGEPRRALSDAVVDAISTALAEADPGAELLLNLPCPACGEGWRALLDIGEHLWRRVSAEATALLGAVHGLAWAYGWSEDQILALSPARRQWYLDRVGA